MNTDWHVYWVGTRKTDVSSVKDVPFYGTITLFGDGKDNNYAYCLTDGVNRVNHNVPDDKEDEYIFKTIQALIEKDERSRFYFYNPNAVYYIKGLDAYKDYFLNVNDRDVMTNANNKTFFQTALEGKVSLLTRYFDVHRNNCDYSALVEKFGCDASTNPRFVFQAPVASGGNGTYIVSKNNVDAVKNMLSGDNKYIVSVYRENNIPVNLHAIIFDDGVLLSPGSIQIMKEDDNRLLYRGADFIGYRQIDQKMRDKFVDSVRKACEVFRETGYRGVCGIDGMICGDDVILLEMNNRFQASTGLLNMGCADNGVPSTQAITLAAFEGKSYKDYLAYETMQVNYSNYFFTDNGTKFHSQHIHKVVNSLFTSNKNKDAFVCEIENDGYDENQSTNALAYLYRLVFNTNIVSINADKCIQINENVCEPDKINWFDHIDPSQNSKVLSRPLKEVRDYYLKLKVALMMQGVVIDDDARKFIEQKGGLRPATNNAVDLFMSVPYNGDTSKYMIINAPTDVKFIQFSPFTISLEGDKLFLFYYGKLVDRVGVYPLDPLENNYTKADPATGKKSVKYSEVAFLSTDRLRVHLTNSCIFKTTNCKTGEYEGCHFCNIAKSSDVLDLRNIEEVVEHYCKLSGNLRLKHFLVGGQTAPASDKEKIIDIIKIIRKHARFAPIYAMVIPYPKEMIKQMYEAGMNQLSCNIEVFDDKIARKYMPGKRATSKNAYVDTLKYATTLMGRTGNVRSMIIVGLETRETFIAGIKELAQNGIQPILSVFRPLPDTPLGEMNAPSMMQIASIYREVQDICKENGLLVGPECVNCQNNTLALPSWMEE